MVEAPVSEQIDNASAGAGLGVACAIHDSVDAGVHDRPRAHHTGLDGDVERASGEPVVARHAPRIPQRDDLGMRRRIAFRDGPVGAAADDLPGPHDHRAHGHLPFARSAFRQCERRTHERLVLHGHGTRPHSDITITNVTVTSAR
jgi:hypothetical protein